ncbi:hypothetical protein A9404_06240 [Halothiobacillus diazotrophicus]|uniref:Uncharacterized protein n=1 Tax=Halothiobacillus diazotrophicus TaxID=1860122 RepID=A0A191ZGM6_9GAMM|nr:hypothetical protein [Halothiobacillus diazotrophicus]ANJ67034.1 hypothetical protein A9404_06240 [Halothiobacillus diazotrophicus]
MSEAGGGKLGDAHIVGMYMAQMAVTRTIRKNGSQKDLLNEKPSANRGHSVWTSGGLAGNAPFGFLADYL